MFLNNFFKYLISRSWISEPMKMVIVVRTDIGMGKGKVGAQCAHASVQCCMQMLRRRKTERLVRHWMQQGSPKIVAQISNEVALHKLAKQADERGLTYALIRDAGRTQLEPGTYTVLGIGPGPKSVVDLVTGNLKLL